jgi:hypothetical protein
MDLMVFFWTFFLSFCQFGNPRLISISPIPIPIPIPIPLLLRLPDHRMTMQTEKREREMDFHLLLLPIIQQQIHRIATNYSPTLSLRDSLHLTVFLH